MCKRQERTCEQWLYHLTAVWNFAIRKIELNADNKIYFSRIEFNNILAGHSVKLGIPAKALQGTLFTAFQAWRRCFKGISGKPRLKGKRNKLTSIFFFHP